VLRNRRVHFPNIPRGYTHKGRKATVAIYADYREVLAHMALAHAALKTAAARDVHLCTDEVAGSNIKHLITGALHNAAELMPERYRQPQP
jgi:hypothetical protein